MILIKNTQRKIKIDKVKIKKQIQEILNIIGYPDFDINIWFTTNKTIKLYNKNFRNKDKPTDILSFAYHPNLKAGQKIKVTHEDDKNLGDLIISLEYTKKDVQLNWNQTLDQRLTILLVHGTCHLLGYDHITDADYKVMNAKEKSILNTLKA